MPQTRNPDSPPTEPLRLPRLLRAVILFLLLCQAGACIAGAGPALAGRVDLRPFYSSGLMVRTGHAAQLYLYDVQQQVQNAAVGPRDHALPFLYPPFAALLFVPLTLFSYRGAFFVLFALNLGLLFATAALLRSGLPALRRLHPLTLPALFGCLFGVSIALMQGQISFLLLLLFASAWLLMERNRSFAAGLVLSLTLAKFQLALPVLLLFLLWRRARIMAGFLTGALGLALISLAVAGRTGLLSYRDSLLGIAAQTSANAAAARQRFGMFPTDMPNLHGLTFGLLHGAPWGLLLNIVLSVLVLVFAARQRPSLAVALPAAMLVSYHLQPHDLTLLLLPLTLLLESRLSRPARQRSPDWLLLAAISLLILPLAALVMGHNLNYLVSLSVAAVLFASARIAVPASAPQAQAMLVRT